MSWSKSKIHVQRALVGAVATVVIATGIVFGVASPANAATATCGWPRCTAYLNKAETNQFAYQNVMPRAPKGVLASAWYAFLVGHHAFVVQYANRGLCVA